MNRVVCCKGKNLDLIEEEFVHGSVVEYNLRCPTEAKAVIPIIKAMKYDCVLIKNADMLIGRESVIRAAREYDRNLVMTGITNNFADINIISKRKKCIIKQNGGKKVVRLREKEK